MKRFLLAALIILTALALCLSSCESGEKPGKDGADSSSVPESSGNDGPEKISGPTFPPELSYDYDLTEYISLPEHSQLKLNVNILTVSDADVDEVIADALARAGSSEDITGRGAREGDTVTYDAVGVRPDTGEEIDRGTGRTILIGSGSYLAGFADHLVGHTVGETVKFRYTYPEDHYSAELAGTEAEFTVVIKGIKVITPAALDDEFVRSLGIDGVSDVAGYREHVRSVMQNNADAENEQKIRDAVYAVLDEGSTVLKRPEKEWNYYAGVCSKDADNRAGINGVSREAYIDQTYGSQEAYQKHVEDYCAEKIKKDLITYSLAREYGVTVDPAEYERELRYGYEHFASAYGVNDLAQFEEIFSADLSSGLLLASALNAAAKNAIISD